MARVGRIGADLKSRALIALFASLDEDYATITAQGVASQLGCSVDAARHLIAMLRGLHDQRNVQIPLYSPDGDEDSDDSVALLFGRDSLHGYPLRLSYAETNALLQALRQVGLTEEDELVRKLSGSLSTQEVNPDEIDRTLGSATTSTSHEILETISVAIESQNCLSFDYQKPADKKPQKRIAQPLALRLENEYWYLDAFDLRKREKRVFRVDRMSSACVTSGKALTKPKGQAQTKDNAQETRIIGLIFKDRSLLENLPWPKLTIKSEQAKDNQTEVPIHASIPYYGGDWLVRRLASCGSLVQIQDEELKKKVGAYARKLLAACPDPSVKP